MTIELIESLARRLWALYTEIHPNVTPIAWEDLTPAEQAAWLQLAEEVRSQFPDHEAS
jgi:hypothetical protein